jgi:hypothetical protein
MYDAPTRDLYRTLFKIAEERVGPLLRSLASKASGPSPTPLTGSRA